MKLLFLPLLMTFALVTRLPTRTAATTNAITRRDIQPPMTKSDSLAAGLPPVKPKRLYGGSKR